MKNLLLFAVFVAITLTSIAQTVTDIDGNVYNTVTIGTQVWMKENLKTTKFSDGTDIPLMTDVWDAPNYGWYNNDSATYANPYGALYNGYSVKTGNLCPSGWHVPTNEEWTTLADYLDGDSVAGGKLKETGTTHWISPNTGATNETGFTALPGGISGSHYSGSLIGEVGFWWSATRGSRHFVITYRYISYDGSYLDMWESGLTAELSVRCLKHDIASKTNSINSMEITLYPNPATEKLSIEFNEIVDLQTSIELLDISGKVVYSEMLDHTDLSIHTINLSALAGGIYFIKISSDKHSLTEKVIKVE
jgi:uncharacterized protein (TIGR02145 family)